MTKMLQLDWIHLHDKCPCVEGIPTSEINCSFNLFVTALTVAGSRRSYLRLFPPLPEAGLGVLVETIWQWTVPRSSMSQMAPNTSVAGMP